MSKSFKITGVTACTPGGLVKDAVIVVADGRIVSAGTEGADAARAGAAASRGDAARRGDAPSDRRQIDGHGCVALPGFIDIHCHGAALFDLTMGMYDPEKGAYDSSDAARERGLVDYAKWKAREGVANVYIGTWAASKDVLRTAFAHLARYMAGAANGTEGSLVRGGLLEGSFFNRGMSGAQNPAFVFDPAPEIFDELNESGVIRLANVVPDFGEPAYKLMDHLARLRVAVGAGHTDATAEQFRQALGHGLRYVIHFTNGPTGGSYKPFNGGGAIEATLQTDELYAEQICDGYHVNPAYVRDIIARKGRDRIIAVTDQVFTTGSKVRRFASGGLEGEVAPDGSHVRVLSKKNTLFGSCLTMDTAFGNLLSWLTREMPGVWHRTHEPLPLEDALSAAARMCSTNPAKMLGLDADPEQATGALEPGNWADIVLGELDGRPGAYRFKVKQLFVRGRNINLDL